MKKDNLLTKFPEDVYKLTPWDDGYLIYDKTRSTKRSVWKYLGFIKLSNNKYIFNNKEYSDPVNLIKGVEEYNTTLPFDPDIYNPMCRNNYRIEMATDDYLTSLGFKRGDDGTYILESPTNKTICKVNVKVDFDTTKGSVTKTLKDFSFIECEFNDLDSAIGAINSVVASDLLITQSVITRALDKMNSNRSNKITKTNIDFTTLSVVSTDFKQKLVGLLEDEIKKLKEE